MITHSIIQKSQLEGAHRLDAEYYQPEYFIDFTKGKWQPVGEALELCQYGISKDMNEEGHGYPIFRMNDIKNAFLNEDNIKYIDIPENIFNEYRLEKNDILFNRVNAEEFVGRTGIVKLINNFAFASYLIRLRTKRDGVVEPDYLNIFLNSSYGIKQIRKFRRRAVNQANVNAEELKQIKIATLPLEFQSQISRLSDESWKQIELSKLLYQQAENLLLEELGLKDFQIEDDLSFIVNLSEVIEANRIDADFFQPKYQKLIAKVKMQNAKPLEQFIANYATGFPFKSEDYLEQGMPLIRINNIKKGYLDLNDTAFLTEKDQLLSPKDIAKSGDIVLSMSGTIGMTAVVPEDIRKCSVNQRILKFTPKNVEADYLVLVLNTIVGFYQLERIGTGGVQTNISYKDIKNILIPDLVKETQQKIADLVRKSHEARRRSKELLEEAKREVEEMIEQRIDK